jgi:hypothetical protein
MKAQYVCIVDSSTNGVWLDNRAVLGSLGNNQQFYVVDSYM